jgi:hypothetical protein
MAIPIPDDVRELPQAPPTSTSTPRADGAPRNWVVWAGLEDDRTPHCQSVQVAQAPISSRPSHSAPGSPWSAAPTSMASWPAAEQASTA